MFLPTSLCISLPEAPVLIHAPLQELVVLQQTARASRPATGEVPQSLWRENWRLWRGAFHQVAAGGVHLLHDAVRVLRCVVDVGLVVLHVLGVHGIVEALPAASLFPPAENKDEDAEEKSEDRKKEEDDPPGELCADVEDGSLAGNGLLQAGGHQAGVGANVLLGGAAEEQGVVGEHKLGASAQVAGAGVLPDSIVLVVFPRTQITRLLVLTSLSILVAGTIRFTVADLL